MTVWLAPFAFGAAATILATGSIAKFVDTTSFLRVLDENPLTKTSAPLLARSVPLVEAVLAALLIVGRSAWPAWLAAGLFCTFAVVSLAGPESDCMCGPFVPKRSKRRIAVSLVLAIGLVLAALADPMPGLTDRLLGTVTASVAALTMMTLFAAREVPPDLRST